MTLQLHLFFSVSSIKFIIIIIAIDSLVKNLLNQLIKNLLALWQNWKRKSMINHKLLMKILLCLGKKSLNLIENWGRKSDKTINKKPLNLDGTLRRKFNNCCQRVK